MPPWSNAKPLIFFVAPPKRKENSQQEQGRRSVQTWAERQDWLVRTRRTVDTRVLEGENSGRILELIEPLDANDLYQVIHRHPTAVIQIGDPAIRLNPSAAVTMRNTKKLQRFVRYKAFWLPLGRVDSNFDPKVFLEGFSSWMNSTDCAGERDARCMPLHVISPNHDWSDLHIDTGITEFEKVHGRATKRTDEDGRQWNTPNALHGREKTTVAGVDLRAGFHWDVVSSNDASSLHTSSEVWKFARNSYCNVYPDASVRRGQSAGKSAKLVWQAERPATTQKSGSKNRTAKRPRRR
ncbi:hypothetical protein ACFWMR_24355 [Amycolatopsis thailandensis]|uniref:hypothetical protein n=1 Tax=Amycolatopsis thailandensis TaxID=589330 RepID=UPI0036649C6E